MYWEKCAVTDQKGEKKKVSYCVTVIHTQPHTRTEWGHVALLQFEMVMTHFGSRLMSPLELVSTEGRI